MWSGLHLATTIKARLVECWLRWLSFWKVLPSPQRYSVRVSIGFLVTSQRPSPPIAEFGRVASSSKSLGGSKLLSFKKDGGICVLRDLQCNRNILVRFPRSVPQHKPVFELYRQFLQPHGLVFALICTINCETLYRQECAFPYQVQSIEFTTGGLQSSCRNNSRMISGNRMHLSSILSLFSMRLEIELRTIMFQLITLEMFPQLGVQLW